VHRFPPLPQDLSTIVRNRYRTRGEEEAPACVVTTTPTAEQGRALAWLMSIASTDTEPRIGGHA
jgi:hypothetical protein